MDLERSGLTKAQKQRADIAREYFKNRKEQAKIVKEKICDRWVAMVLLSG
jgi:hypothetical protein